MSKKPEDNRDIFDKALEDPTVGTVAGGTIGFLTKALGSKAARKLKGSYHRAVANSYERARKTAPNWMKEQELRLKQIRQRDRIPIGDKSTVAGDGAAMFAGGAAGNVGSNEYKKRRK